MLDLFSGIGGFSLAAEWVWGDDLEIVAFCEIDKYCRKVLNKNFPSVPIYKDIKELDGEAFKDIDLITGGFPCQDISVAGKGAGIEGARSGLWSEMHRLISHIRPRYVIIENVPMLTVRGGTRVISDLAEIGMDAEWQIVGADDVGAWHRRKRIWIVSYPKHIRRYGVQESEGSGSRIHSQAGQSRAEQSKGSDSGKGRNEDLAYATDSRLQKPKTERQHKSLLYAERGSIQGDSPHPHCVGEKRDQSQDRQGIGTEQTRQDVPDTDSKGLQGAEQPKAHTGETSTQHPTAKRIEETGDYWSVEPDVGLLADGLSTGLVGYWDREPDIPRVSTGVKDRVNKLKGLGNAIVPQCAIVIMELIKQADAKPQ